MEIYHHIFHFYGDSLRGIKQVGKNNKLLQYKREQQLSLQNTKCQYISEWQYFFLNQKKECIPTMFALLL